MRALTSLTTAACLRPDLCINVRRRVREAVFQEQCIFPLGLHAWKNRLLTLSEELCVPCRKLLKSSLEAEQEALFKRSPSVFGVSAADGGQFA